MRCSVWRRRYCKTIIPGPKEPVGFRMNLLRKSHFGQISRLNSLNMLNIRLIQSKNLTQNGFPSLRSPKPDRLLSHIYGDSRIVAGAACKDEQVPDAMGMAHHLIPDIKENTNGIKQPAGNQPHHAAGGQDL